MNILDFVRHALGLTVGSGTPHPDPHEELTHIVVLQLVVLGAGITKVVEAFGWIMRNQKECKVCRVHVLQLLNIALLQLQYAWTCIYEYPVDVWPFWLFCVISLVPLAYLISSELLSPDDRSLNHDLSDLYNDKIKIVASLILLAQVLGIGIDLLIHPGEVGQDWQTGLRLGGIALLAALWRWDFRKHPKVHKYSTYVLLILLAFYCIRLTPSKRVREPQQSKANNHKSEGV